MLPASPTVTISSRKSRKDPRLSVAGEDGAAVLVVLDEADHGALVGESGALLGREAEHRAFCAEHRGELLRSFQRRADLLAVGAAGALHRVLHEPKRVVAVAGERERLGLEFRLELLDERLGLGLLLIEAIEERDAVEQVRDELKI